MQAPDYVLIHQQCNVSFGDQQHEWGGDTPLKNITLPLRLQLAD